MLKMKFYKHLDWLGKIAVPKDIREHIKLQEGDKVEICLRQDDAILITKVTEDE